MTGFVKLYESILRSSVWLESNETRLVWIAMIVAANVGGHRKGGPGRLPAPRALDALRPRGLSGDRAAMYFNGVVRKIVSG